MNTRKRQKGSFDGIMLKGCQLKTGVRLLAIAFMALLFSASDLQAQRVSQNDVIHRRGRLWDNIWNDGFIGNGCAWDYCTTAPLGMYPGFSNFVHPIGGENNAINTFVNANFHNFRSGVWIVAKDLKIPGQPPAFNPVQTDYEFYASGAQGDTRGVLSTRQPIEFVTNYIEEEDFNPLLPEEMSQAMWDTNLGITVTRNTYIWSFPGYRDFIIYDYTFENTGQIVSQLADVIPPNVGDFQQTLSEVWFSFHSGVSVSTKSQINFHGESLPAISAGGFGWQPPYHDFYHVYDEGALVFSTNYNGGKEPVPFDPYALKDPSEWKAKFGDELLSPAAFGWLTLYADPAGSQPRSSAAPDMLRIDNFKQNQTSPEDLEFFKAVEEAPADYYRFVTTEKPEPDNPGNRFNYYTQTFGPYTMPPGQQVRIVVAEIAGVMDYADVIAGDPDGKFPQATIDAMLENAEHARQAVAWGIGATVDGLPLAADVPEPPTAPTVDAVNASQGTEKAAIAITWDKLAETATIEDGAGNTFYNGLADLDGYRIYRSEDFQFANDVIDPVFRGATWEMIADIPAAEINQYFDAELDRYSYVDETVQFGFRYGYYVAAYNENPATWTSANGTVVNNLPPLESGPIIGHSQTPPVSAAAGPVSSFDIYVVPNPFVYGDPDRWFGINNPYRIEFRNLPEEANIRIYTVSGDLIRTLGHGPDERGNLSGTIAWDQKSDSGLRVAPGLYVYHVESRTEGLQASKVGKLMIVR